MILPLIIEKWENFVFNVEEGYDESIYDYINDLSIRDSLQFIIDNSPINLHGRLHNWIKSWDNRLILATIQVDKPLLPPQGNIELGWWWFRLPRHPGNELLIDLEN